MRRKIKLAFIDNETARKASFKKRRSGLMKKVRELTILCDVSACIIIYGPGESDPAAVWPNEEEAQRLIRRFLQVPEMVRCKKMVTQESYLRERAGKMSEQVRRLHWKNKETVLAHVAMKIDAGNPMEEIGAAELKGVKWMLEEKAKEVDRRRQYLRQGFQCFWRGNDGNSAFSLPPPTAEEIAGNSNFPLDWTFSSAVQGPLPDHNRHCRILGEFSSPGGNENGNGNEKAVNKVGFRPYGNRVFGGAIHGSDTSVASPAGKGMDLGYGYFEGSGNGEKNDVEKLSDLDSVTPPNTNVGVNFGPGGGNVGNSGSEFVTSGCNNANAGIANQEIDSASGESAESGENGGFFYDFSKHWPAFSSQTP